MKLEHLIANTEEDYIKTAIKVSSNIEELDRLRTNTRKMLLESPFCDGITFTKDLESVYLKLWKRHCLGQSEFEVVENKSPHREADPLPVKAPRPQRPQRPQEKQEVNNENTQKKKNECKDANPKKKRSKKRGETENQRER